MRDQRIEMLSDFEMKLPNHKVLKINYKPYMTVIGGKIWNILTNTKSSQAKSSYLWCYPSKIY